MAANDAKPIEAAVAVRSGLPANEVALADMEKKLSLIRELAEGWDGYNAPSPSPNSIERARAFAVFLLKQGIDPIPTLVPSVVGGVGFTFYADEDRGNIEFDNEGDVTIAFSRLQGGERSYSVAEVDWDDGKPEESALEAWNIINGTLHG